MKKFDYILSLILCAVASTCLSILITLFCCDKSVRNHKMSEGEVANFITLLESSENITVEQYIIHYDSYSVSVLWKENEDDSDSNTAMACFKLKCYGFMDYGFELVEE